MTHCFGPFQLDAQSRRLRRDGELVAVPDRHIDILLLLVSRAGEVVSKDALIEAAWKDVAVTDNSLEQAISSLRRTLGRPPGGAAYIETLARRGYRFAVPVERTVSRYSVEALEEMLAPHRAFVEGRAALETLEREAVERASAVFEDIIARSPDYAPAHLGLANALALRFESTRADTVPDRESLKKAVHHAGEACRFDPSSGEAWAALGLVCHQSRDAARAVAAVQRAVALEPGNWRHHVRLAYVGWGEERLRAAHRALQLLPHLALAHWLAATVHIARQALAEADCELVAGAAAQDQQEARRFGGVGLHLLHGLVRLAEGDQASALQEFERELTFEPADHIYTREVRANTWCAIGALRLRHGRRDDAVAAFGRAVEAVAGHPVATAARSAVTEPVAQGAAPAALRTRLEELRSAGGLMEATLAEATFEAVCGRAESAAALVQAALERAPAGSAGWIVPVDPLLHVHAHPQPWQPVLATLRSRAA